MERKSQADEEGSRGSDLCPCQIVHIREEKDEDEICAPIFVILWHVKLNGAVRVRCPIGAHVDPMLRRFLQVEEHPITKHAEKRGCRKSVDNGARNECGGDITGVVQDVQAYA